VISSSIEKNYLVLFQVDLGSDAKHCFCKSSELLAVVE